VPSEPDERHWPFCVQTSGIVFSAARTVAQFSTFDCDEVFPQIAMILFVERFVRKCVSLALVAA
jgi:hypothetical protein